jgi:hypothetical protein
MADGMKLSRGTRIRLGARAHSKGIGGRNELGDGDGLDFVDIDREHGFLYSVHDHLVWLWCSHAFCPLIRLPLFTLYQAQHVPFSVNLRQFQLVPLRENLHLHLHLAASEKGPSSTNLQSKCVNGVDSTVFRSRCAQFVFLVTIPHMHS